MTLLFIWRVHIRLPNRRVNPTVGAALVEKRGCRPHLIANPLRIMMSIYTLAFILSSFLSCQSHP